MIVNFTVKNHNVTTSLGFHRPDALYGQPALWLRQRDQTAEHGQAAALCETTFQLMLPLSVGRITWPASPLAKATRPSRRTRANRRAERERLLDPPTGSVSSNVTRPARTLNFPGAATRRVQDASNADRPWRQLATDRPATILVCSASRTASPFLRNL